MSDQSQFSYDYYTEKAKQLEIAIEEKESLKRKMQIEIRNLECEMKVLINQAFEIALLRNQYAQTEGSRVYKFVNEIADGFMVHCRSVDKSVTRDEILHFARGIIDYDQSYVDWGWNVAPDHKWKAIIVRYRCMHGNTTYLKGGSNHGTDCIHRLEYPYDETAQKWAEGYRLSFSPMIAEVPSFASFDKKTGSYQSTNYQSTNRFIVKPYIHIADVIDYIVFFAFANQLED